jgi:hypothetical protein
LRSSRSMPPLTTFGIRSTGVPCRLLGRGCRAARVARGAEPSAWRRDRECRRYDAGVGKPEAEQTRRRTRRLATSFFAQRFLAWCDRTPRSHEAFELDVN